MRVPVNAISGSRTVAARYAKRAYVFHGGVLAAVSRLWPRHDEPRMPRSDR